MKCHCELRMPACRLLMRLFVRMSVVSPGIDSAVDHTRINL